MLDIAPALKPARAGTVVHAAENPGHLHLGYLMLGRVHSGILGHHGPSTALGGGVGAEAWFANPIFLRGVFSGVSGPRRSADGENISVWGLQPEVALGYDWRLGILSLGPILEIAATWTKFNIELGGAAEQSFSKWSFRGSLGVDLRWVITRTFNIVANGFVGARSNRERFERESDHDLVLATPLVDWSVCLGVVFFP